MASARARSRLYTPAVSPYSVSFIKRTAWSSPSTTWMPMMGPKLSSRMTFISAVTSTSTVGSK
jgi:hypothetical protein